MASYSCNGNAGSVLGCVRDKYVGIVSAVLAVFTALLLLCVSSAAASDWAPLIERLASDGFDRSRLETLFSRPEVRFEPDAMAEKIHVLLRSRSASANDNVKPRTSIRRHYLSRRIIARARSYKNENREILEDIRAIYGVPMEIVVSILLIETHLGRNTGNRRAFNRLASMALGVNLEVVRPHLRKNLLRPENEAFARSHCQEKGDWAYEELKALLRLAERQKADPLEIRGSFYGAIGLCQFMPSNVFSYGVDADGDGRIDPFTKTDALHSIANYLRGHGWRPGMARNDQHRVIFDYNRSTVYANTVLAVAEKLKDRKRTRP